MRVGGLLCVSKQRRAVRASADAGPPNDPDYALRGRGATAGRGRGLVRIGRARAIGRGRGTILAGLLSEERRSVVSELLIVFTLGYIVGGVSALVVLGFTLAARNGSADQPSIRQQRPHNT